MRALLIDFDGTLAETLPGLRAVYEAFVEKLGLKDQAPTFRDANGLVLRDLIFSLCRQSTPALDAPLEWNAYWQGVESAILKSPPAPGAEALLAWAKRQGWLVGIASAGRSDLIQRWLAHHGLETLVDDVVGSDHIAKGKPDPAIYLMLMDRLGVTAPEAVAIEDSASGVASAKSAGLEVLFLDQGADSLADAGPATRIASLAAAYELLNRGSPYRGNT